MLPPFHNIYLQDIAIDDANIVIALQRNIQYRQQAFIQLYRHNIGTAFCQSLCQRTDAGTYLQNLICRGQLCCFHNTAHDIFINQEILPQLLIGTQLKAVQNMIRYLGEAITGLFTLHSPIFLKQP